ncbi:MAG: ATP-dependent protease ATPase subunit HslU [Spirochaetia bacterium]|nr:ATP-dependent protease ATPase subunit HslU [Spirochaetia bacterium]MCF7946442.1 ATP-dependent protease ATPase subunit HslU [Spirochaetia bacterium]
MDKINLDEMAPKEIVQQLDKYIIGQDKAKKSVAVALRNRVRRKKLPEDLREEIAPKNIIMIGPTGVGKTEIARRLSKLCGAPFIKVEATKFTEVGYVGRDVESMVRDLMRIALNMVKNELAEKVRDEAEKIAEDKLLELLLPGVSKRKSDKSTESSSEQQNNLITQTHSVSEEANSDTREKFRKMLREGKLDERQIDVEVSKKKNQGIEIFSGGNMEDIQSAISSLGSMFGSGKKKKRVTVEQAKEILLEEEMSKLIDDDQAAEIAKERVEEMGIIFVDEIDKVTSKNSSSGVDVSREGVQRDILPIVEGAKINTKYGIIDTSHILFIAAGAFHISKPSDLIPELQGRFPLRVELDNLQSGDFFRILTEPENSLTKQYRALMETENVKIEFKEDALKRLSQIAEDVNAKTENIGARRLHTIMELLLEDISYTAVELSGQTIPITEEYVNEKLASVVEDRDLSRYIL